MPLTVSQLSMGTVWLILSSLTLYAVLRNSPTAFKWLHGIGKAKNTNASSSVGPKRKIGVGSFQFLFEVNKTFLKRVKKNKTL